MMPPEAITPAQTHVLLALLSLERPTVRAVCAVANRSPRTVHKHLAGLRALGLVAWEDRKHGTLRALVGPVDTNRKA